MDLSSSSLFSTSSEAARPASEDELRLRLARLETMTGTELREEWARVWGSRCYTNEKRHLSRRIAWRLKSLFYGTLSPEALVQAEKLVDFAKLRSRIPADSSSEEYAAPAKATKPASRIIRRTYKGVTYEVVPLRDGRFSFNGATYTSLSAIAKKICGNNISGNRFFKLQSLS